VRKEKAREPEVKEEASQSSYQPFVGAMRLAANMLLPALTRSVEVISHSAVTGGLHPHHRKTKLKSGFIQPQAQTVDWPRQGFGCQANRHDIDGRA
jgi:hypothetical protein